ncbi:Glycogen synthase [compost metagenome]
MNLIAPRQRVLMLAWEYPPRVIGGLAHAVCHLSRHLALAGLEIHVITCYVPEAPPYEIIDNVHIHRVPVLQSLTPVHFLDWMFQMNLAFIDYGLKLAEQGHYFDLVHAHDWLVYYCAIALREEWNIPLVATIHATEFGRNLGSLDTQLQQSIHQIESKLVQEADRIITCSQSMSLEVQRLFALSEAKVSIIPNGIEACSFQNSDSLTASPSLQLAIRSCKADRIIGFIGRLVHEKGIHILIQAMSLVLPWHPTAKLLIAGTGPMLDELMELASPLGDRIQFIGFLGEPDKSIFLQQAELCVFPSLYEPFGIVALEAMINETPIIVSNVGGLGEIVEPNWNGYQVPAGDVEAVAKQIQYVLTHPTQGRLAAKNALAKAQTHYNWSTISALTAQTYEALA